VNHQYAAVKRQTHRALLVEPSFLGHLDQIPRKTTVPWGICRLGTSGGHRERVGEKIVEQIVEGEGVEKGTAVAMH